MVTKSDLSGMGHYLRMGLWGLIIASVVNFLIGSSMLDWLISLGGIALFLGLTAYDTQQIKRMSEELGDNVDEADFIRVSILGR